MHHLITGGAGFLGRYLSKRLIDLGHSVTSLDLVSPTEIIPGVKEVQGDVTDRHSVRENMRGVQAVHHLAAANPILKSKSIFHRVNVEGSKIVLEEAVNASVSYITYISSSSVFGGANEFPITSQTPPCPIEPYGISKLAAECLIRTLCNQAKLPLLMIRAPTVMGQGRLGIFYILFKWISEGRNIYLIGPGKNKIQMIHVKDLFDFYFSILNKQTYGEFQIGALDFKPLYESISTLIHHAGTPSKIICIPVGISTSILKFLDSLGISPLSRYHYLSFSKDFYFDISPAISKGLHPHYSNEDMLIECYNWFQLNKKQLRSNSTLLLNNQPIQEKSLNILKWLS